MIMELTRPHSLLYSATLHSHTHTQPLTHPPPKHTHPRGKKMIMELFSRTLPPHVRVRHHSLPWLLAHVEERCRELERVRPPRRAPGARGLQHDAQNSASAVAAAAGQEEEEEEESAFEVAAGDLAASCHLLCIDKVQFGDNASAAAFGRLLEELLWRGCWVAFMVRGRAWRLGPGACICVHAVASGAFRFGRLLGGVHGACGRAQRCIPWLLSSV